MTLLRELIDIPERVRSGDFVLRLTEGMTRPKDTLRDYVVTPQLVACFDDALAFIRSALDARSSKAAYRHGSFGAGKSHFMAVLLLLLNHDADVRSVAALAPVVAKHSACSRAGGSSSCRTTCSALAAWTPRSSAATSTTSRACIRRRRCRASTSRSASSTGERRACRGRDPRGCAAGQRVDPRGRGSLSA
jgi:hypothetical protein